MGKSVLFVARNFYPSTLGGPSVTLYNIAKSLVEKGINVSVITTNDHVKEGTVPFDRWTKLDGIYVRYVTVDNDNKFHKSLYSEIRLKIKECDIVILSSIFYIPAFVTAWYAKKYNKKIIWSPRGELFQAALSNNRFKSYYILLLRLLYGRDTLFHGTSGREISQIKHYFGANAKVIQIPNYLELPIKVDRKPVERYLLYVGRIAPIKALDKLIIGLSLSESFRQSDYKFYIVGGIENQFIDYYERLKCLIKDSCLGDKILFKGVLTGMGKNKVFANAYFSFLISESENFGNVVLEALSQGTPVVASKGTPWENLESAKAGFWIDNSSQNICSCVNEILSMTEPVYNEYRNNAFALAAEFDISVGIHNWMEVIGS